MSKKTESIIADFTEGSVPRQLIAFAAPLFLSNMFQVIYNMVDMIIVGKCAGKVGLSSVSVGGDIANFMTFVAMGFSNAGQVIISQLLGAGKREKISGFIGTMFSFLMVCAFAISVFVLFVKDYILHMMNTPAAAWNPAMEYLTICTLGMVFIYGYSILSAVLRGFGDARHPFVFVSISAALNVILDILFVRFFDMGAAGAALATVLSQTVSFLLAAVFMYRNKDKMGLEMTGRNFRIQRENLTLLVKLGTPMAIKSAAVQFSKLFVNSWVNSYDVAVSAVSGIGNKLNTIANLFSNSVNTAGSSMVGQNIGAQRYKRVSKVMLWTFIIDFSIIIIIISVFAGYPEKIFELFTTDDSIMSVAMEYVPIGVLVFLGSALRAPMNTLLNGSGNYKMNFAVAIFDGMVNRIGFGLLFGLALNMKYLGFWLGDAVASFTPFIIGSLFYLSGKWKTNDYIIKDDAA